MTVAAFLTEEESARIVRTCREAGAAVARAQYALDDARLTLSHFVESIHRLEYRLGTRGDSGD